MTERSEKFDKVKNYYTSGLWSAEMVQNAIGRWITEAEAAEILGNAPSDEQ